MKLLRALVLVSVSLLIAGCGSSGSSGSAHSSTNGTKDKVGAATKATDAHVSKFHWDASQAAPFIDACTKNSGSKDYCTTLSQCRQDSFSQAEYSASQTYARPGAHSKLPAPGPAFAKAMLDCRKQAIKATGDEGSAGKYPAAEISEIVSRCTQVGIKTAECNRQINCVQAKIPFEQYLKWDTYDPYVMPPAKANATPTAKQVFACFTPVG